MVKPARQLGTTVKCDKVAALRAMKRNVFWYDDRLGCRLISGCVSSAEIIYVNGQSRLFPDFIVKHMLKYV